MVTVDSVLAWLRSSGQSDSSNSCDYSDVLMSNLLPKGNYKDAHYLKVKITYSAITVFQCRHPHVPDIAQPKVLLKNSQAQKYFSHLLENNCNSDNNTIYNFVLTVANSLILLILPNLRTVWQILATSQEAV